MILKIACTLLLGSVTLSGSRTRQPSRYFLYDVLYSNNRSGLETLVNEPSEVHTDLRSNHSIEYLQTSNLNKHEHSNGQFPTQESVETLLRNGQNQKPLTQKEDDSGKHLVFGTKSFGHKARRDVPESSYVTGMEPMDKPELHIPYVGFAAASPPIPPPNSQPSQPVEETFNIDGTIYRTGKPKDGILPFLPGLHKVLEYGEQGQAIKGQYSYTSPDGSTVETRWTSDERGFLAEVGVHRSSG